MQKSRPTLSKFARERARNEKHKEKAARRALAKQLKAASKGAVAPGQEDPDIAGIVPGPQPPQED
jgi:hypothetical protein